MDTASGGWDLSCDVATWLKDKMMPGACMIGAFLDEAMNEALGLDGIEEFVIYISSVGKKP